MKMKEYKYKGIILIGLMLSFFSCYSQQNDLSLSQAITKALEQNYGIIISKLDIEAADITNTLGNAGGLPSVGFDVSSQNSLRFSEDDETSVNNLTAQLGFSWKIFDGFRVKINMEKLQELENLSMGQSAVVIENTIQDVIMSYYYILLLSENLKIYEKILSLSKDRYDYEQAKFELGGTVSVNVLLAKNNWLNDKAEYLKQEINYKDAIRNLNFLLGDKENTQWHLTDEFEYEKEPFVLSAMMDKMLSDNQSLKNQYINQSLKEKERRLKESDLLPELSLSGGITNTYNRNNVSGGQLNQTNTFYPYANLTFSYDIFSGGTRTTAIKVAGINEEISEIEKEEIIHSLSNLLLGEYDNYLLKNEILEIQEENLKVAEMNLEIAQEKFKNGSITSFEYRDILLIYLNAAQSRLSVIYELIDIETELTRLTGGFINQK